jgi:hypothetical protein
MQDSVLGVNFEFTFFFTARVLKMFTGYDKQQRILETDINDKNRDFTTNLMNNFDVLTSIVSFIWAPSTRVGVAYGVKLTLYQSQQLPRLVGGALLRKQLTDVSTSILSYGQYDCNCQIFFFIQQ